MKNFVLVDFMGSGKSAIGRRIAKQLNLRFLDMDAEIEQREGYRISEIFSKEGEARFRVLERSLARELAKAQDLVIATGGGIVLDPRNLDDLRQSGVIIVLGVTPETVMKRVGHQTHRPLLESGDPSKTGLDAVAKREKVERLLSQRDPIYRAAGKYITTDDKTLDQVVTEVLAVYQKDV